MTMPAAPGTLYLVSTPIGNLDDISARALRTLREADLIACEDTRHTQKLLSHFGIERPTISYHEHNEKERANELTELLRGGAVIALVSDAGTPAISDPGHRLVGAAIAAGIPVVPIPGANAILAALVASGLPVHTFSFHGFLPARTGARRRLLSALRDRDETLVFFESPHRIAGALEDLEDILGGVRPMAIAREMTKVHEQIARGTVAALRRQFEAAEPRGELTLVIGGAHAPAQSEVESAVRTEVPIEQSETQAAAMLIRQRVRQNLADGSSDPLREIKAIARETRAPRSEVYRIWQQEKNLIAQPRPRARKS
jgi:16S rRNA (cytidine1402-2'-O)-methyltransferase